MRSILVAAAMLAVSAPAALPVVAYAQAAAKFSTAGSKISDLIANPEAKAVLEKHIPEIMQYAEAIGGQTLKELQGMAGDQLTDKMLADIDADLAKIK